MTIRTQELEGVEGKTLRAIAITEDEFGKDIEIRFSDGTCLHLAVRVHAQILPRKFDASGELLQEHTEA